MNIIYSPEFNSTSYINFKQRQGQLLGLKVCGSTELLAELELRAGFVALEQSEPERLVAFHGDYLRRVFQNRRSGCCPATHGMDRQPVDGRVDS